MRTSNEIRKTFLEYFKDKGHTIVESSSLVPVNDPTLLFTNAGMNQFKDVFLGVDQRNYVRATTSQKCVRAGGKHNDLDTVGRTPRHHTFFEMLGNFSFGDYFKAEAIGFAWEFLTRVVELPPEKFWITVYEDDDEAYELWQKVAGVNPERIIRMGEKDNFWSMGDTGPCGPCSEIMYDRGEEYACGPECGLGNCECDRWLEIWNLVFMQYNRDENGKLSPLPRPSIDTGMGLERLCSVLQKVESNFDTDLFVPIIKKIEEMTGQAYNVGEEGFPFRVIADHSRACTFLIADGVLPSNDGRGYVLRRILRRAVRFGRRLGIAEPFLFKTVAVVVELTRDAYPELLEKQAFIEKVIKMEEERFYITVNEGIKKAEELIEQARKQGQTIISGDDAFMLYDTYGFPLDLTEDMAEENHLTVDQEGFNRMMEMQRIRAREANKQESAFMEEVLLSEVLSGIAKTEFRGYEKLEHNSKILALVKNGELLSEVNNDEAMLITAETPFYAECGGQVADTGLITGKKGRMEVTDVQKIAGWTVHLGRVEGTLKTGEKINLQTDRERRMDIARNHTATHLLHKALRKVLGEHAQQKGSLVEPSRLRFDFSHLNAMNEEEIRTVEDIVNEAIRQVYSVSTQVTDIDNAREMGAMALFGEKYGEEVRVVKIKDFSMELCGGTHVANTGQIGLFKIISEGSVGSGLRRIEAVTGRYALDYFRELEKEIQVAASLLKTSPGEVAKRIEALNKTIKDKEKESEILKARLSKVSSQDLVSQVQQIKGVNVLIAPIAGLDANSLRQNAEMLRDQLGNAVVVLATTADEKVLFSCFVSKELVAKGFHAGKIVGTAARIAGGGGGGRPDMAQAGGKDAAKLEEALEAARNMVKNSIA